MVLSRGLECSFNDREINYAAIAAYAGTAPAPRTCAARADLKSDLSREVYDTRAGVAGPILVGGLQQVIDKLMRERELFDLDRFLCQVDIGGLPYAKVTQSIELLATRVLPAMRKAMPEAPDRHSA